MTEFTFGSLFAGIGGFDLGLERAGMVCKWQVEIDPFCQKVLEKHWPHVARYGDVHDVGRHNLETVDLICGGFPCQPVSFAGKGKAQSDSRWLWPQFARVVSELQPRWVLVENVPGLLHRGMGDVLVDLAQGGYDAEWDCIPASALGAWHKRDRVWAMAYPDPARLERWHSGIMQECASEWIARSSNPLPNPQQSGLERKSGEGMSGAGWAPSIFTRHPERARGQWESEPDVGRVAYGVPNRVDRLRSLGNAVVPQVAEWIGRRILNDD